MTLIAWGEQQFVYHKLLLLADNRGGQSENCLMRQPENRTKSRESENRKRMKLFE
jgi:hypothetical protein